MVIIPPGRFQMGSNTENYDEKPVHTVNIAYSFAMGKYEVTFAQWDACVNAGGCSYKPDDNGWGRGNRPVIYVSWNDITQQYIPWLNQKTGKRFRLPSEAEWEYAARAGTTTRFSFGESEAQLCQYGNHADQATEDYYWRNKSCDDGVGKQTGSVGSYRPNAFGLYDMHGNVWEWVEDCFDDVYIDAPANGDSHRNCTFENGEYVSLRGGSWTDKPDYLRSAGRNWEDPSARYDTFGFRLVLEP